MMHLTAALYQRLTSDPDLVALLSTYQGLPAIFTADPVPPDVEPPFIVISASPVFQAPDDTKTTRGRELARDIRVYAATGRDADHLAMLVRKLLHRQSLDTAPWTTWRTRMEGPMEAPTDGNVHGRLLTIFVSMRRP